VVTVEFGTLCFRFGASTTTTTKEQNCFVLCFDLVCSFCCCSLVFFFFLSRFGRRLSGSKRNALRIRTEAGMVQDRFNKESEMLYQEQHEHMEERLKQRREKLLQNLQNIGGSYKASATGSGRRGDSGAPMQNSSGRGTSDPFAGIEAFREEHRRNNQVQRQQEEQPNVIRHMDLSSSMGEQ
jgi:hypothetical protein